MDHKHLLKPFEVCEFANVCDQEECLGKMKDRVNPFSCAFRRWFLKSAERDENE